MMLKTLNVYCSLIRIQILTVLGAQIGEPIFAPLLRQPDSITYWSRDLLPACRSPHRSPNWSNRLWTPRPPGTQCGPVVRPRTNDKRSDIMKVKWWECRGMERWGHMWSGGCRMVDEETDKRPRMFRWQRNASWSYATLNKNLMFEFRFWLTVFNAVQDTIIQLSFRSIASETFGISFRALFRLKMDQSGSKSS